jgi:glucosamine--fructose-6-phosphate aminotransferase (isomerizing)
MKEISYIHASGYPSAELKHGVIALITPEVPTVVIAPDDSVLEKNISNIEEVRARKGPVIAIGTEGTERNCAVADDVITVPETPDYLSAHHHRDPLQLLAYLHRVETRLRRGQATQPGEERDGGVAPRREWVACSEIQ